jgi:hypothetical protein
MPKSRLSALVSLVLVFLSGALVGAVAHRLYMVNSVSSTARPRRPDPEEIRHHLISEMRDRVKLDGQQVARLEKIYDDTRERFDALNRKRNIEARELWDNQTNGIRAMLRPDQLPLFEKLRAERDAERERRKKSETK